MPYIDPDRRDEVPPSESAGELAFELASACTRYLEDKPLSFDTLSDAVAALECTKLELYRQVLAPYEDLKRVENGDVWCENEDDLS